MILNSFESSCHSVWALCRPNTKLFVHTGGTKRKAGASAFPCGPPFCLSSSISSSSSSLHLLFLPTPLLHYFLLGSILQQQKGKWNCFLGSMAIPLRVNFQRALFTQYYFRFTALLFGKSYKRDLTQGIQ